MEIKTERLILRPLGTEYIASAHAYASDAENTKYMMFLPNEAISETIGFLSDCENEWKKAYPSYYEFAVILDGRHIGAVSIYPNTEKDEAELGWILDRRFHGHGYATEAARALIRFASGCLALRRFIAHCDTENLASQSVMKKLGFVCTGVSGGRRSRGSDEERQEYTFVLEI